MSLRDILVKQIQNTAVLMYSKSWCPYCRKLKDVLARLGAKFTVEEIDLKPNESEIQDELAKINGGHRTVPMLFIGGKFIGGCDDTLKKDRTGELPKMLQAVNAM